MKKIDRLFEVTDVYYANYNSKARIVVNQGGTSSGKTHSIMQALFTEGLQNPREIITVVGQDVPNLKGGVMRNVEEILYSSPRLESLIKNFNKTDRIYTLYNDTKIEFKSYDGMQDAKSGKRDRLFINEVNGVDKPIYDELARRTNKKIYLDYNPNAAFWVHEKLIGRDNVHFIRSDHRHNPFISEELRYDIENTEDPEQWKVYARGITGKFKGLIFPDYRIVDAIPEGAKHIGTGLDFGFTNDVTAMPDVYLQNGELWLNELLYERGLVNVPILGVERQPKNISDRLKGMSFNVQKPIVADSAEPKSIMDLSIAGWNIKGVKKGPESIRNSIDILKRYKLNVTRNSVNMIKELNSYMWAKDKNGECLNVPIDYLNHLIDGLRYVALDKLGANAASETQHLVIV